MDPYYARVLALLTDPALLHAEDPELVARLQSVTVAPEGWAPVPAKVEERTVPGPHGDIPVRVYGGDEPGPWLVWCHGGGWVGGGLDMPEADSVARELVTRVGGTVVSVDYRLCVDGVHYPVPLDDVVAAFRWAVEQAEGRPVALGGASAGANLAAGATLRLRDEGGPVPSASLLAYPCVHGVLPPASEELAARTRGLSPLMAFAPVVITAAIENYLGAEAATAPPYAMAAHGDLAGYPPTLVVNDEYDGLRASGEAFAQQLTEAGTHVEVSLAADVAHGHLNHPWLAASQESIDVMARFLARFVR